MAKKQATEEVVIEITNRELVHNFVPAIDHLGNLAIKNIDILTKVIRARRSAKVVLEDHNDTRQKIVELDCIKDKDGKPQTELDESTKAQRYTYKTTDIEAETSNRVVELLDQKVKFKVTPIKLTTLRNVDGLSANTIDSLYEFVDID